MGFKVPTHVPAERVPELNRAMRVVRTVSEKAAPEAFRWLGWSVAIAAVQFAALQIHSRILSAIPVVMYLLLILRIQWALGLSPKDEKEGQPVPLHRWGQVFSALVSWVLAYQVAFTIPAELVDADLLRLKEGTKTAQKSDALSMERTTRNPPVPPPAANNAPPGPSQPLPSTPAPRQDTSTETEEKSKESEGGD